MFLVHHFKIPIRLILVSNMYSTGKIYTENFCEPEGTKSMPPCTSEIASDPDCKKRGTSLNWQRPKKSTNANRSFPADVISPDICSGLHALD